MIFRSQTFEWTWPWIGAAAVVYAWHAMGSPFPPSPEGLFGAAATVASVFASFLGVSKAIMLTIKNTEIYNSLKKLNYTDALFGYLRIGIICSVIFAALSIFGFFVDRDKALFDINIGQAFSAIWICFGALSFFTYLRISNIIFKILKLV